MSAWKGVVAPEDAKRCYEKVVRGKEDGEVHLRQLIEFGLPEEGQPWRFEVGERAFTCMTDGTEEAPVHFLELWLKVPYGSDLVTTPASPYSRWVRFEPLNPQFDADAYYKYLMATHLSTPKNKPNRIPNIRLEADGAVMMTRRVFRREMSQHRRFNFRLSVGARRMAPDEESEDQGLGQFAAAPDVKTQCTCDLVTTSPVGPLSEISTEGHDWNCDRRRKERGEEEVTREVLSRISLLRERLKFLELLDKTGQSVKEVSHG